jgi:hypothetical protein
MKKMFLSLLVLAASLNVMAIDITAKAKLTLTPTGATSPAEVLYLVQASDLNEGYNTGYCALVPSFDTKSISIFVNYNGEKYGTFGTKDLSNIELGIKTNDVTDYTITVSDVTGDLTITDLNDGSVITLADGVTIPVSATANTTLTARMKIGGAPAPATPEICHRYGKLEVRGSNGMTVQVLNLDGTATTIADTDITTDAEVDIDLDKLTPGQQYLVKWNGKELIIQM